tara:strand:- start:12022 stop:12621 length:600 start_codon:yes stop_codon:yes gene_type:complete
MTPAEHKDFEKAELLRLQELAEDWCHPLSKSSNKLTNVLEGMKEFKLAQEDVPLIIKLTENPNYFTSKIFTGAVDLFSHDCIHILLGRGVLPKDEAFVIGYTMGSSKRMKRWRRNLFLWVAKNLYPEGYKFKEQERYVFYSGVMAGSRCSSDLTKVQFKELTNMKIDNIRKLLGIDKELLKCYYCVEKNLFNDKESQRL